METTHNGQRDNRDGDGSAHVLLGPQGNQPVNRMHHDHGPPPTRVTNKRSALRNRISNFQWTWYACTMSTGGLAIAISESPKQFNGLETIGVMFLIIEIFLFIAFTSVMIARFVFEPKAFFRSITDPMESFFFGCFWLTQATIMGNVQRYGVPHCGPWLITTLEIVFWLYVAITIPLAVFLFTTHFRTNEMTLDKVQPSWVLGIYPAMLAGTVASIIAPGQPPDRALAIIIAGIALQGLGFMLAFMLITLFIFRCFSVGLPPPKMRCGMFILVGTPGYTATALAGLADAAKVHFPPGYMTVDLPAGEILVVVVTAISAWLWLLSFMFCAWSVTCIAWDIKHMEFDVTWWACIFPNIGWILSTALLGNILRSQSIQWVSCAMIVSMGCLWVLVAFFHLNAIVRGNSPQA